MSERKHRVEVYEDEAGEWRWSRIAGNGEPLSGSTEGYIDQTYCLSIAEELNPGVEIIVR